MQKFTTALAVFKPKEKLEGFGSSSRGPHPKEVARTVFGKTLDGPSLFAYLFRRFGYPNVGWDDYKQLVEYALTTPIPGLYLTVYPSLGTDRDPGFHFGCLFNKKVAERMYAADHRRNDRYFAKLHAWAGKHLVCGKLAPGEKREVLHEFTDKDNKPNGYVLCKRIKGDSKRLAKWLPRRGTRAWGYASMTVSMIYDKLHPEPKHRRAKRMAKWRKHNRLPWHKWKHDAIYRANKAFEATMLDLLKATNVRDLYFNAAGPVPDDQITDTVKYYDKAGIAGKPVC